MALAKNKLQPRMKKDYHVKKHDRNDTIKKLVAIAFGKLELKGLTPLERERAIAERGAAKKRLYQLQSPHLGNKELKPGDYWRPEGKKGGSIVSPSYGKMQHKV